MRTRVMFRLTMPNVESWNGRWSGEGKRYVLVRHLNAGEGRSWQCQTCGRCLLEYSDN